MFYVSSIKSKSGIKLVGVRDTMDKVEEYYNLSDLIKIVKEGKIRIVGLTDKSGLKINTNVLNKLLSSDSFKSLCIDERYDDDSSDGISRINSELKAAALLFGESDDRIVTARIAFGRYIPIGTSVVLRFENKVSLSRYEFFVFREEADRFTINYNKEEMHSLPLNSLLCGTHSGKDKDLLNPLSWCISYSDLCEVVFRC